MLEVAGGTGEAACVLAERHGCLLYSFDAARASVRFATAKARSRGLRRYAAFTLASGRTLPVADAAFDAALCIGSPEIVGIPDCWREMRRAVKNGAPLVMSDAVLVTDAPDEVRAGWPEWTRDLVTFDGYRDGLAAEGLAVEIADTLPRTTWDEYHRPMLALVAEVRRYRAGEPEALTWADDVEGMVHGEQALLDHIVYAHFLARRKD